MSTIQPEALRLADMLDSDYDPDWFYEIGVDEVVKELRRLHAENSSLKVVFDEWIAKTEWVQKSLKPRELGKHRADILHARIADLEAQLASIGAGYTAADMATAAAQGFRDGAASLAASAGSEPVAWGIFDSQGFYEAAHDQGSAERFCAHYNKRKGADPLKPYTASPLYTHPSPPEGAGWMPIETAPKDVSILLFTGGVVAPVYCGRQRYGTLGEPQQHEFAWRCDSSGRFATPRLWMHIPPLPASEAKGA